MSTGGQACELCEFAITKLDEILKDNNTDEEIKDALDSLCTYLPKSISGECKTFVDTYTDIIIDMLTQELSPKEVNMFTQLHKKTANVFLLY